MRKDGRRIRTLQPMYQVMAHLLVERNDAMNMIELNIPEEPLKRYRLEAKEKGYRFSHLTIVLAAYVRTLAEFPLLNRFVVNKRVYARNEISVGMVVLKPGKDEGTMNKMYFEPTDTIFDIQKKLDKYVEENREEGDTNATDDIVRKLLAIPGLCRVAVNILKWMDNHNILPYSIIKASPMHCSMSITNLASIGTNHIFHHTYNFGTTSIFVSMGNPREIPVRKGGEIEFRHCIPWGIVMDERIADGCQFAHAFKVMHKYLHNPSLLEEAPRVVNLDIP